LNSSTFQCALSTLAKFLVNRELWGPEMALINKGT